MTGRISQPAKSSVSLRNTKAALMGREAFEVKELNGKQ
jgi:hypothetical protein